MQRSQTNVYNNQGWLAGVSADARFDAGGGATLSQQLAVSYQFDASGNRGKAWGHGKAWGQVLNSSKSHNRFDQSPSIK